MHSTRREILVGVMFFLGLGLVFLISVIIAGEEVRLFEHRKVVTIRFPSVSRIEAGTPVTLNGVPVGNVTAVTNNALGSVDCEVSVREDVVIHEGYGIAVATTLFGSKSIVITDAAYDAVNNPLPEVDMAKGLAAADVPDMMGALTLASVAATATLETVNITLEEVNETLSMMRDPDAGLVGRVLSDDAFADDVHAMVIEGNETMRSMRRTSDEIADFLRAARDGDGVIPMLINDAEVKEDFRQALEDISVAVDDLSKTAADIRRIADRVDRGEGILGWLIADAGARDNLDSLLANLTEASPHLTDALESTASVMGKIDSGNSTLGRLINDDALYIQLTQTIRAANRSLEDLRETTPITTFANLLFQAFQ